MMSTKQVLRILLIFIACHLGESKDEKRARNGRMDLHFKFKDHFEQQRKTSDDVSLPLARETILYSRAAKKYLQIIGRRIVAGGKRRSIYSRFLVESDNFGRVRFKGIHSGRYLCMTKTGKLVAKTDRRSPARKRGRKNRKGRKKSRSMKKKSMKRCVFKEEFGRNGYTTFKLAANESWYLAIDKNGQPKRGRKRRQGLKSIHFIERPIGVKQDSMMFERSRRIYRQRIKKKQAKQLPFEKRLRSSPLLKDRYTIVDSSVVGTYIEKLQSRKKELKQAIQELIELKRNVDGKKTLDRTIRFAGAFKRIISKLKANGVVID